MGTVENYEAIQEDCCGRTVIVAFCGGLCWWNHSSGMALEGMVLEKRFNSAGMDCQGVHGGLPDRDSSHFQQQASYSFQLLVGHRGVCTHQDRQYQAGLYQAGFVYADNQVN